MKKSLKPALIMFLTSRPVTAATEPFFHNSVPVFMLHRVSHSSTRKKRGISSGHLRNCLDYLVDQNYTFVSLENLISALKNNKKLPPRSVVFTMDDGYKDQAELTAPIFLDYSCPLTFFIVTGMVDQFLWPWDAKVSWIIESSKIPITESSTTVKKLNLKFEGNVNKKTLRRSIQGALKKLDCDSISETLQSLANDADVTIPDKPPSDFQPMTWDMARSLEDMGVHFAPHSASHNILSRLDQASMEQEILKSWSRIKSELSDPLKIFCYPNGTTMDFSNREIAFLKDSSFTAAVSTIPNVVKYNFKSNDYLYSLPRLSLPDNMPEFIQYCSWIESARAIFK